MILGFGVMSIRARHKQKDREGALRMFNDKNCSVQVLVTSNKISATVINLRKDCTDTIFVDDPSNAQVTL